MNLSDWARDELSRGAALYTVSNVVCDALNLDIAALRARLRSLAALAGC